MPKITIQDLFRKKVEHEKITMLTAYDYPFAQIVDEAGIDAILVGETLMSAKKSGDKLKDAFGQLHLAQGVSGQDIDVLNLWVADAEALDWPSGNADLDGEGDRSTRGNLNGRKRLHRPLHRQRTGRSPQTSPP